MPDMRHRKITEHKVRALKPKDRRYTITEDGLTVEVHPSGRRAFYAKYREHGRQHKERLGEYPQISVKDAREAVLELRHRLTVQQSPVRQSNVTLEDYLTGDFRTWAEAARKDGEATVKRLRHHFITRNPSLGSTRLKNLTTQQLENWKVELQKTHKPSTVKRTLGDIIRALNLAVEWGHLRRNPAEGIKAPVVDTDAAKLYLDDAEFKRLTEAVEKWESLSYMAPKKVRRFYPLWFVIFVKIALNTGGRKGEILKLKWKDVDEQNRMITFAGISTKNARTRRIPISDKLLEHLKAYNHERLGYDPETDEDVLLDGDTNVFPVKSIKKPWARLQDMAMLHHVTPHTLRHHVASKLVLQGVALSTVRDLLGHKSIQVTSRYLSVRTEDKMEALNLL